MVNSISTKRNTRAKTQTVTTKKRKTQAISNYKAALDFLFSNTNYESAKRLRYNEDTFSLDRTVSGYETLFEELVVGQAPESQAAEAHEA